jgi:hypothetical protein
VALLLRQKRSPMQCSMMSFDPQASEAPAGEPPEDDVPSVTSASGITSKRLLPVAEPAAATSFLADFVERAPVENEGQRQANGNTCMNSSVFGARILRCAFRSRAYVVSIG